MVKKRSTGQWRNRGEGKLRRVEALRGEMGSHRNGDFNEKCGLKWVRMVKSTFHILRRTYLVWQMHSYSHANSHIHIWLWHIFFTNHLYFSATTHIVGAHQTAHKYSKNPWMLAVCCTIFHYSNPVYDFMHFLSMFLRFSHSLASLARSPVRPIPRLPLGSCCRYYESFRFTLYALARLFSSTCFHVLIYDAVLFILSFNHMGFTASRHTLAMRTPAKQ